jgi:hypothetical protein
LTEQISDRQQFRKRNSHMNAPTHETEFKRHALAIGVWENEGGAPIRDSADYHYGRRIEIDGSWSIYHVFTGTPAEVSGHLMIGMTQSGATEGMVFLNRRNERRRRERDRTRDDHARKQKSEAEA